MTVPPVTVPPSPVTGINAALRTAVNATLLGIDTAAAQGASFNSSTASYDFAGQGGAQKTVTVSIEIKDKP